MALDFGPAPQTVLARSLHIHPAAISRLVHRLALEGDIERTGLRRHSFWRLTEAGRDRLQFLRLSWDDADLRLRSLLGVPLVDSLLTCVERLPKRWREPPGAWRD